MSVLKKGFKGLLLALLLVAVDFGIFVFEGVRERREFAAAQEEAMADLKQAAWGARTDKDQAAVRERALREMVDLKQQIREAEAELESRQALTARLKAMGPWERTWFNAGRYVRKRLTYWTGWPGTEE